MEGGCGAGGPAALRRSQEENGVVRDIQHPAVPPKAPSRGIQG